MSSFNELTRATDHPDRAPPEMHPDFPDDDREPRSKNKLEELEDKSHAALETAEAKGKTALRDLTNAIRKPATGAALTGAVILGAAVSLGIAETLLGAGGAYIAYRALRRRRRHADERREQERREQEEVSVFPDA